MEIPRSDWEKYIRTLSAINKKAADVMKKWIDANGYAGTEKIIDLASGLVQNYGEAASTLACEMYDAIANASGSSVPAAEPARVASYGYITKAVQAKLAEAPTEVPALVGRMVKQAGADTTLQNAKRDGAQFAWIPNGDTCAFCITLASRGWQYMSKTALKNGHAEHIHANCDCEYAVRFNTKTNIAGYDPEKYREIYYNAEGNTPQEKVNAIRRAQREENKDKINAQKRIAYESNHGIISNILNKGLLNQSDAGLLKSIKSWRKNIEQHQAKIADPEKYDAGWTKKTESQKAGLLHHWRREIEASKTNITYAKAELERREVENNDR